MAMSSLMGKLSPSDMVLKAIVQLQREKPFFGHILLRMNAEQVEDDSPIQTFAVNKYGRLFFHGDFAASLNPDQMKYVLCHEVLHIAKGDFFRLGDRNPTLWNIASDCIINDYCNLEGLTPPDADIILPDRKGDVDLFGKTYNVRGKCAEEVYEMIEQDIEEILEKLGDGEGHGNFDQHLPGDSNDKGESTGEADDATSDAQIEREWKQAVVDAAVHARQRGNLPGFAEEWVEGILNPKVDWRDKLRKLITNEIPVDYCNRIPNRNFNATKVWQPRMLRENINIYVSVDCSGSTHYDREDFISECLGILTSHSNVSGRLICWDTKVNPDNDIEINSQSLESFRKLNIKDINGGTTLSSYADHIEKKGYSSQVHIHLTDGYIESKPKLPTGRHLFVLTKDGRDEVVKKYGEVVWLN
jgi:predicted metal-dependent peptidase